MVILEIDGDDLIVSLHGWDRALAGRRSVRVPLAAISDVVPAPELIAARPRGTKFPGSSVPGWPGPIFAGTFVERGGDRSHSFWSLRRATADQILRISVADVPGAGRYRTLILQVPDAKIAVREIERAAHRRNG